MIETCEVLITVKTYPTLSSKYAELVCTAGILGSSGKWIRIYPLPFRQLYDDIKYKKYQWIKVDLEKNGSDQRPESYKVSDWNSIEVLSKPLSTKNSWATRRRLLFAYNKIHTNLTKLIEQAHRNELSLAIYKPKNFLDLTVESVADTWDEKKLSNLDAMSRQLNLWQTPEETKKQFKIVKKLPYKFSYRFEDEDGTIRKLMIEDWELGALYWKMLDRANGNKDVAVKKVRQQYWDNFMKLDTHLFLGTTLEHHNRKSKNPFVIIGVFPAPKEQQLSLLQYTQPTLPFSV